ncbi:MAG: tRNA-dihydrouridine synthase [Patescibacteria group bacterium]
MSFWDTSERPIFVLAPMADVTDAAFRRIIAKYSKVPGGTPYITWTEFVSADGLARAPEAGKKKLLADLMYTDAERPIVAQFFGSNPQNMEYAARLAVELGFDGIDLNMGCPVDAILHQGTGAAHIHNPVLAQEVIAAAKRGANGLPVSVKTRLGYNKDELEEWLPRLLETELAAITIHARTRKEMSLVPARWDRIARAVEIRNEMQSGTLILGNGDLIDVADARMKVTETGADGAMLGRAIFGNPWLFAPQTTFQHSQECENVVAKEEKLRVMVEHTQLFEELLPHKSFMLMKKHYKAYVHGFEGAAELRAELMLAADARAISETVDKWLAAHR